MAEGGGEHKYKSGELRIDCFPRFPAINRSQIDRSLNFPTIPENYGGRVKEPCLPLDRVE